MNKCTKSLHFPVALLLCAMAAQVSVAQSNDQTQPAPFDPARTADMIITGLLSEEQFNQQDLTADQLLDVFMAIKKQRGWTMPDEDLELALPQPVREKLSRPSRRSSVEGVSKESIKASASWQPGGCNQMIVVESGNKNASWAFGWTKPRPGECGSDTDDTIIAYNTPNYPRMNPNNVRLSSPFWWVRAGLQAAYPVSRGLAANGLCSPVTRACIGSRGMYLLGNDVFYTYLWEK